MDVVVKHTTKGEHLLVSLPLTNLYGVSIELHAHVLDSVYPVRYSVYLVSISINLRALGIFLLIKCIYLADPAGASPIVYFNLCK